jgi:hypothetical protein
MPLGERAKEQLKMIRSYNPNAFDLKGLYFDIDKDEFSSKTDIFFIDVIDFKKYKRFRHLTVYSNK